MPTNEEGEFELILGNKQLLSVFFIVVVLLGVFFTMGYIVGRNMSPAAGPQMAQAGRDGALVVEPVKPAEPAPRPVETAQAAAPEKPSPMPSAQDPPAPPPVKTETPKPEPVKPAPAKVETPKPEPVKPAPPKTEPAKVAPSAGGPGMYLQIAATKKPDADMLVDVLGKKGFRATTQAVPDSPLFRVLVGPARDADDLAKLRSDLEAIGFKGFPKRL